MSDLGTRLHPLEYEVYRVLGSVRGERWLVAVSGGLDSMVLLAILRALQGRLAGELGVAHVHHGPSCSPRQTEMRDQARAFVRKTAQTLGYDFFDSVSPNELRSEEALRRFRLETLEVLRRTQGYQRVAFAHHRDDLLETRLIRLIRGTGPEGLRAMRVKAGAKLRPFLGVSRASLETYAMEKGVPFLEDPSNRSLEPLRNWIRLDWLPRLEAKRAGSREAMERSLQLLAETLSSEASASHRLMMAQACLKADAVDRLLFSTLKTRDQRFVLALYLRKRGAEGLTRSHLEEVVKRLDTPQNELTFKVGPYLWHINAGQVFAEPVVRAGQS